MAEARMAETEGPHDDGKLERNMSENEKKITAAQVKALRDASGAGMMECKRALTEAGGDFDQAMRILRERGLASARKRTGRVAREGVIESYIHFNHRVGVLVEVNCETDFVANTDEFRTLARDIALHIASAQPRWLTRDDVPREEVERETSIFEAQAREQAKGKPDHVIERIVEGKLDKFFTENVLLDQPFVRDDSRTVGELIDEASAKLGEKVAVRRFTRYLLGEELD
jgi:elongation factor Ts